MLKQATQGYPIKKSCLEQLSLLFFDSHGKRFKQVLAYDILKFCFDELQAAQNRIQRHLEGYLSSLESSHISFLNECLRFIYLSGILAQGEKTTKVLFEGIDLSPIVYFCGSPLLKKNAVKVVFLGSFWKVILKVKQSHTLQMPDWVENAIVSIFPVSFQPIEMPVEVELMSEEQQMLILTKE